MFPTNFDQSNGCLDPPPGVELEDCSALCVWQGHDLAGRPMIVSCWKPTAEELEEINRTGRVWLLQWGYTIPPSAISGLVPFDESRDESF